MERFQGFFDLNVTEKLAKKYCFQHQYLFHPNVSTCFFLEKHKIKIKYMSKN